MPFKPVDRRARMFGENSADKIKVWDDDVMCCIDMRNYSEKFLTQVIRLAQQFDRKLAIHGPGTVIEADMAALVEQIAMSNAYKFRVDPQGYLIKLNAQQDDYP